LCIPCAAVIFPAGDSGKPGIVSLVPGGTITYENRNLFGKVGVLLLAHEHGVD